MIDRREVNRALAKAIAYEQCGKDHDAAIWAERLVRLLECAEILNDNRPPFDAVASHRGDAA